MPRFAANLSMLFTDADFLARFERAAAAGFEAVEYLFPYAWDKQDIADRLQRHDLQQALFNMPPGNWEAGERGLAALPGREAEFREGVAKAIEYARHLKCTRLHAMAGCPAADVAAQDAQAVYVKNLEYAAQVCREHGITVLIEPINTRDMPGYFLSGSAQASRVVEDVGADNLKIQYDCYHMQIMEGNLAATMELLLEQIDHVQIAGVPGRHEPDVGEIHYPYLFDCLDAWGYQGWIGCEYRPQGETEAGLGWFGPYRRA